MEMVKVYKRAKRVLSSVYGNIAILQFSEDGQKVHAIFSDGRNILEIDLAGLTVKVDNLIDFISRGELQGIYKDNERNELCIVIKEGENERYARYKLHDAEFYLGIINKVKNNLPLIGSVDVVGLKKELYHFLRDYKNNKDYHSVVFDGYHGEVALLTREDTNYYGNRDRSYRIVKRIPVKFTKRFIAATTVKLLYNFLQFIQDDVLDFYILSDMRVFIIRNGNNMIMSYDIERGIKPVDYLKNREVGVINL